MFSQVKGQQETRRTMLYNDQFGREWIAEEDITSGDPCTVLTPHGWAAPAGPSWFRGMLTPPEDVVKMVPRLERARKGYQVYVDHALWLSKWDARAEDHDQKLADFAKGMTGASVLDLMREPPAELRQLVGNSPFTLVPRQFIQAAAAGNTWATGQSGDVPTKAYPVLEALRPMMAVNAARRKAEEIGKVDPLADDADDTVLVGSAAVSQFTDPLEELDLGTTPARRRRRNQEG